MHLGRISKALECHRQWQGKLDYRRGEIKSAAELSLAYSPGLHRAVNAKTRKVFEYTGRGNTIAVVSDGSAVLGLGILDQKQRSQ